MEDKLIVEKKLKELLNKKGYGSGTRLAEYLGVPRNYVSRWSKVDSRYKIPREHLPKIAEFFGKDLEYFFGIGKNFTFIPFLGKADEVGPPKVYPKDAIKSLSVPVAFGKKMYAVEDNGQIVICDMEKTVEHGSLVHFLFKNKSGLRKFTKDGEYIVLIDEGKDTKPIVINKIEAKNAVFVKCIKIIVDID